MQETELEESNMVCMVDWSMRARHSPIDRVTSRSFYRLGVMGDCGRPQYDPESYSRRATRRREPGNDNVDLITPKLLHNHHLALDDSR